MSVFGSHHAGSGNARKSTAEEMVMKIVFEGQVRRHRVEIVGGEPSLGVKELRRKARKLFAGKLTKRKITFKYEDDEKELVTISNNTELAEAFRVAREENRKSLRITISHEEEKRNKRNFGDAEEEEDEVGYDDEEEEYSDEVSGSGQNFVVNVEDVPTSPHQNVEAVPLPARKIDDSNYNEARTRIEARKEGRRPPPPTYEAVVQSPKAKSEEPGRRPFFQRHSTTAKTFEKGERGKPVKHGKALKQSRFMKAVDAHLGTPVADESESKTQAMNPTIAGTKPSKPVPLATISGGAKLFLDGSVEFGLGGEAELLPDGRVSCLLTGNGFTSVGAQGLAVATGKWYYEVTLLTSGCMQVGWAAQPFRGDASAGEGVGDDKLSWAYDGYRQLRWHGGIRESWGPKWRVGHTVCCALDADRGIMRFALDGKWGTFQKSTAFFRTKHPGGLLPAVSFSRGEKFRFNFGAPGTPLKFTPPDASYLPVWEAYGTDKNIAESAAGGRPTFGHKQTSESSKDSVPKERVKQQTQEKEGGEREDGQEDGSCRLAEAQEALTQLILDERVRNALSRVLAAPALAQAMQNVLAVSVAGSRREIMRSLREQVPTLVPLGLQLVSDSPELIPVGMHVLTILTELGVFPRRGRWGHHGPGHGWRRWGGCHGGKRHHSGHGPTQGRANNDTNWRQHGNHGRRFRRWIGRVAQQAMAAAQTYVAQASDAAAQAAEGTPASPFAQAVQAATAACAGTSSCQDEAALMQQAIEESVRSASDAEEAELQKAVELSIEEMKGKRTSVSGSDAIPQQQLGETVKANPHPAKSSTGKLDEQPRPRARFVKDNVMRKAALRPGESFKHSWKLMNNGNRAWPANVTAQCTGGDPMEGAGAKIPVSSSLVQPQDTVDVTVSLIAPQNAGRYISYWRLFAGEQKFGDRIWVDVTVVEPATEVPHAASCEVHADLVVATPKANESSSSVDADWVAVGAIMRNSLSSESPGVEVANAPESAPSPDRDCAPVQAEPETQHPAMEALVKMGFGSENAKAALTATGGNVPEAVVLLLGASR